MRERRAGNRFAIKLAIVPVAIFGLVLVYSLIGASGWRAGPVKSRTATAELGNSLFRVGYSTAYADTFVFYSYGLVDTLKLCQDLNRDGTIDSTKGGVDFVPVSHVTVTSMTFTSSDTLYLRFLDESKNSLGTVRLRGSTGAVNVRYEARCAQVCFNGGRTGTAGDWIVTAYFER